MAAPKKTKIVATVGPATNRADILEQLIEAGVNVFRLNFSHGDHETHRRSVDAIRVASTRLGAAVGILADLQGPKIRTGETANGESVTVAEGDIVVLTSAPGPCTSTRIAVDYPNLAAVLRPGQTVVINDGSIRLQVLSTDAAHNETTCEVIRGGVYSSRKGVNLPNVALDIPSMTEKDISDLALIYSLDVQFVALSFVRSATDIVALRERVSPTRPDIKLIAKIEKPEAADAIDDILDVADAIMVARGDLGVEASPDEVPILQKNLLKRAEHANKPAIVATQMLESMIHQSLPTRAESTDVANAIFDGADAVMLSGETAVGAHPLAAVRMMSRIARTAEQSDYITRTERRGFDGSKSSARAVCGAAVWASAELGHIPICVFTLSGDTALYLSKLRTPAPVYAFSPDDNVVRMLALAFNVTAFQIALKPHIDTLVSDAEQLLVGRTPLRTDERIVIVSGTTPVRGATNSMQVKRISTAPHPTGVSVTKTSVQK